MAPTASSRRSPHDPAKPKAPSREDTNPTSLQAFALAKLLVDPSKQVFIPAPPKGNGIKTLRAPSDMMKNVQGSSAGAGSGTGAHLVNFVSFAVVSEVEAGEQSADALYAVYDQVNFTFIERVDVANMNDWR